MVGLKAPPVCVPFTPPKILKSPPEDRKTQWIPISKQANWEVFCDAFWFDSEGCDAVLRSVSMFQNRLPFLPISAGDCCFHSWHHPQTPGCPCPTINFKGPSRGQASFLLWQFGSSCITVQMRPQALAITGPLAFTVGIRKWQVPLSGDKPTFLWVRTHHPSFRWPALSQNYTETLEEKYCNPAVHSRTRFGENRVRPDTLSSTWNSSPIYKRISHSVNHSYFPTEIYMPGVLGKPIYILQNSYWHVAEMEKVTRMDITGNNTGYRDSNGCPGWESFFDLESQGHWKMRPTASVRRRRYIVASTEAAAEGTVTKIFKIPLLHHVCRSVLSQTGTGREFLLWLRGNISN